MKEGSPHNIGRYGGRYDTYPEFSIPYKDDIEQLVNSGFYWSYNGKCFGKLNCVECSASIEDWVPGSSADERHRQINPKCSWLIRRDREININIDYYVLKSSSSFVSAEKKYRVVTSEGQNEHRCRSIYYVKENVTQIQFHKIAIPLDPHVNPYYRPSLGEDVPDSAHTRFKSWEPFFDEIVKADYIPRGEPNDESLVAVDESGSEEEMVQEEESEVEPEGNEESEISIDGDVEAEGEPEVFEGTDAEASERGSEGEEVESGAQENDDNVESVMFLEEEQFYTLDEIRPSRFVTVYKMCSDVEE